MTRERDIERVLDAWFEPGPTEMPDRLFDDILARVDRVPQRRAWPSLRFLPMNSRIRWLALAAATLVVAVGGLALINRPSGVGHPTPTPKPDASITALPTTLLGLWMGEPSGIAIAPDPLAGSALELRPDRVTVYPALTNVKLTSVSASTVGEQLRVAGGGYPCESQQAGDYTWTLSPGGRVLTIVTGTDPCTGRADAVAGTWWKMDCPTDEDNCLGDLEPGRYASQFVDPFAASLTDWRPRFGALSYTVPAGWSNEWDWPDHFAIVPQGAPADTGIFIMTDVVVVSQEDPCNPEPDPAIGTTALEIVAWLESAPGVLVSGRREVTLPGLTNPAVRVDLRMDPTWTATCPSSGGQPVRGLFTDREAGDGFHYWLTATTQSQFYLFAVGEERTMLINVGAESADDFASLVDEATAIVESFVFTR